MRHVKQRMKLKTLSLYIGVMGLCAIPVICFASSLVLTIDSSTKSYKNHDEFEMSVTFHNTSDKPYVVFPAYVRRIYIPIDGQNAQFTTYPGPVINPWSTAITLNGREMKTIKFSGMRNGDGFWGLEPGRYDLSVSLFIATSSTFATDDEKYKDVDVWRGKVESEKIRIHYLTE